MYKHALTGLALAMLASGAFAAPKDYTFDASHSQVVFSYDHLGFSTTFGVFSGFEGAISFDAENPAASSVETSFPVRSMFTGWEQRFTHFMSDDFFGAGEDDMVSFTSTGIDVTGETTAMITGNLTIGDVTEEVVLETTLNQAGPHPFNGAEMLGFDATTTLSRTAFGLGKFAPAISDEVQIRISLEAVAAE